MSAATRHCNAPIWILDDGRTLGGGQLFALRLGEHLRDRVTIVSPPGSSIGREARRAGLKTENLAFPPPNPWRLPSLAVSSARLRAMTPPDAVLIAGAIRTTFVAQLAQLPNPTVVLMHERVSASRPSVRLALRKCPAMVVVSSEGADEYRRALPKAAIWSVNNFLSPARLREFEAARTMIVPRPGGAGPVLGVLARLIPGKGIDVLIAELARYPQSWGRLIIAGSRQNERYAQAIERAIDLAGLRERISLIGETDDVPSFLSQLDALLVPSTGPEGQPTVILEGLAAGLPIIVRDSVMSSDFAGFPVVGYGDARDLRERLLHLSKASAELTLLEERFGIHQVLATFRVAISAVTSNASSHG